MYPRIVINKQKFKHNAKQILDLCHNNNQKVMGVTKVFCGDQQLVNIFNDLHFDYIGDSRISNLIHMKTNLSKVLLRIPMLSEIKEVIEHADISLNSELVTIKALNKEASHLNMIHKIILMIDLGDLREGIFDEKELFSTLDELMKLDHILLYGIGVNLTCYGGVIPTKELLQQLVDYKNIIEQKYQCKLCIVSGGNSSNTRLLEEGNIPKGINNQRIGEAIVLGRETAYGELVKGLYDDVFVLEAEVIEQKYKPSIPKGICNMNAFGEETKFEDHGLVNKLIVAIGRQDVYYKRLIPADKNITILGSSSDHIILECSNEQYKVGDIVTFKLKYPSLLGLMTSPYVKKVYVDEI